MTLSDQYDPALFGKVAVLYGGTSHEREVSLSSGRGVYKALVDNGIDAHYFDTAIESMHNLVLKKFDRVFNILHGAEGENGVLQAVMDYLKIPFTGSSMMASALCMEKRHSKRIWTIEGLSTLPFIEIHSPRDENKVVEYLGGFPLCVKPSADGSSLGINKVTCSDEFCSAFVIASKYDGAVIAEPWIEGHELTVSIIGDQTFPSIEIQTPRLFYDYAAKYEENTTRYVCPSFLTPEEDAALRKAAWQAFSLLGCEGWGRVDFMRDKSGISHILEINTVPGMTPTSLVPKSAGIENISYDECVLRILALTLPQEDFSKIPLSEKVLSVQTETR
jgi:D-alanine-D-alanine ligase